MARLQWGDYRPDISELNAKQTRHMRNVVPRADGFGPWKDVSVFTQALPAACRGYFQARSPADGTVLVFAATATKLYLLNNTTLAWSDVSLGGSSYTTIATDAHWSFAQFNNVIVASHRSIVMQEYTIGSSSAFANLAGSPPQAGKIAVVGRFLVASDIASHPLRIQWSDVNDIIDWSGGSADFQDLPNGGRIRTHGEISGGVGLICQDNAFRRMVFAPGSEEVFQIEQLRDDTGIICPYSLAFGAGSAICMSTRGFIQIGADGSTQFIGEERVDRTFLGHHETSVAPEIRSLAYDASQPQLVIGMAQPDLNLYTVFYKSQSGQTGIFDRGFAYHWSLKKWAPIETMGEYVAPAARPGLTLEGLDAIAPGALTITDAVSAGGLIKLTVASTATLTTGQTKTISGVLGTTEANGTWVITVVNGTTFTLDGSTFSNVYVSGGIVGGSIDDLPFSLDEVSTASLTNASAMTSAHKLGFFTGDTLEAELETAEQTLDNRRVNINGVRPLTDASSAFGSILSRNNLNEAASEGDESEMDTDGYCPLLAEGRYARSRTRIPAGTLWTYASGVYLDAAAAGEF